MTEEVQALATSFSVLQVLDASWPQTFQLLILAQKETWKFLPPPRLRGSRVSSEVTAADRLPSAPSVCSRRAAHGRRAGVRAACVTLAGGCRAPGRLPALAWPELCARLFRGFPPSSLAEAAAVSTPAPDLSHVWELCVTDS